LNELNQKILVWDLPVRLFHGVLAAGFLSSYVIAKWLGEDSPAFPYHSMLGLTLALMVLLRLIWGFMGTRWTKFSSLRLRPMDLFGYFRGIFSSKKTEYTGHNPATSWTMLVMFGLLLALGWTGYQMATGGGSEDLHGLLANTMLALVGFHVLGVIVHVLRTRDGIMGGMIHGYKQGSPSDAIRGSRAFAGLAFVALIGFFFGSLAVSFDSASQSTKWPVIGTRLPLGEGEEEGASENSGSPESEEEEQEQD
jgi:cytochrome b